MTEVEKRQQRKEAARNFHKEHGGIQAAKEQKLYNYNPIPERGPRGKTVHHRSLPVKHSTDLSRALTRLIDIPLHEDDWRDGIGTNLVEDSSIPHLVVDTGIFVRAISSKTFPECKQVFDLCIDGKIIPCVTESIVQEYLWIIRPGFIEEGVYFDIDSINRLNLFLARCLILPGYPTNPPDKIEEDHSDYKFLLAQALAFESTGRPCSIVSRDGHLLDLPNALEENIMKADYYLYLLKSGLLDSNTVY